MRIWRPSRLGSASSTPRPTRDDGGSAPLKDVVVGGVGRSLWLLFGAVSVLLLIACTNIATLLLARGARREQEIALRYSLGASRVPWRPNCSPRRRCSRSPGRRPVCSSRPARPQPCGTSRRSLPRLDEIGIDVPHPGLHDGCWPWWWRSSCGVLPALRSTRGRLVGAVRRAHAVAPAARAAVAAGGRAGGAVGHAAHRRRTAAAQLRAPRDVDPGFDAVARAGISHLRAVERTGNPVIRRVTATLAEVATVPGIEAVATTTSLSGVPAVGAGPAEITVSAGTAGTGPPVTAEYRIVSPSYFSTMRIPIVSGDLCRHPATGEARRSAGQAMVNRAFADRLLCGPFGHGAPGGAARFCLPLRVVGIVANAREAAVDREPTPGVYACDIGVTPNPCTLHGRRSARSPGDFRPREVERVRAVAGRVRPCAARAAHRPCVLGPRLRTMLLALFALTALSLRAWACST